MNNDNSNPVPCANTGQAIVQKLQGYSSQLFWRVKAALIGLSEWLALLFPF